MSKVKELERGVAELKPSELEQFRRWFLEFEAHQWDKEIESDVAGGKLDEIANAAIAEYRRGETRPL